MLWFVFLVFVAIVVAAIVVAARLGVFDTRAIDPVTADRIHVDRTQRVSVLALGGGSALLLLATAFASYHPVPAGHAGLVYEFGAIVGETGSGPQIIPPWRTLRTVNMQVQVAQFHRTSNEDKLRTGVAQIAAASSETQNVYFDVTVNYQLDRGHVVDLYTSVGPDWFNRLVPSRVQQFFKAEIVEYNAVAVTTNREKIRESVTAVLDQELDQFGISIVNIQIDNIGYDGAFEEAIEQKQVATQNALREQEVVAQREAEARQNEATARGEAAREIAIAEGNATSILTRATAQAEANRQLAASITPALIQYEAISKIEGTKVAILPSGQGLLIDPSTLLGSLIQEPAPAQ